jgi:hypothetical protein
MSRNSLCSVLESVARANALPLDFFVRLIWRESAFRPDVVGPVTRDGKRAQGIAQFMPATAVERGLFDPFNANEALEKSGALLTELRSEFGNVGLAAAAYNAGPQRVRDFLTGSRDLPVETRNYVLAITGRAVEDWKTQAQSAQNADLIDKPAAMSCEHLVISLEQASPRTLVKVPHLSVPSWCYGLNHPNLSVCGPVHAGGQSRTALSQVRRASRSQLLKAASFH